MKWEVHSVFMPQLYINIYLKEIFLCDYLCCEPNLVPFHHLCFECLNILGYEVGNTQHIYASTIRQYTFQELNIYPLLSWKGTKKGCQHEENCYLLLMINSSFQEKTKSCQEHGAAAHTVSTVLKYNGSSQLALSFSYSLGLQLWHGSIHS